MFKIWWYDVRRLFASGKSALIMIAAPAVLVLGFAAMIGPRFFSGGADPFKIAVCNLDKSPVTSGAVFSLVSNERSRNLIDVEFVATEEEGEALLDEGAAALIIIPAGFQQTLMGGGSSAITAQYNPDAPLEAQIVNGVLSSGASLINAAQGSVNAVYYTLMENGYESQAAEVFSAVSSRFMGDALSRSAVFDLQSESSPLGVYFPVEYYAMSIVCIFIVLGALPVAAQAARDAPALMRYYLAGGGSAGFCASKTLSGFAYLTVLSLPCAALTLVALLFAGSGAGDIALVLPSLAACSLLASSLAVLSAALSKTADEAVALVFVISLALIIAGGLIIPPAFFGRALSPLAAYTPVGAAFQALGVLTHKAHSSYALYMCVTAGYSLAFTLAASFALRRKSLI